MSLLIYIIKTIFISGGLLTYYWLFLRNRPFHGFNRYFLLSIPILSLLIPALHFDQPVLWNRSAGDSPIHLLGVARGSLEEAVTIYSSHKKGMVFTWESAVCLISTGITIFLSFRLTNSLRFLRRLKKQSPFMHVPGATLYFVSEKGTPFSFFTSIFWGKNVELTSTSGQQILRHELFHVQQQHTLDILLLESCSIIMWFNPFLHILSHELKAIHEYAADAYAAADTDEYAYAKLLLLHISGGAVPIVHPFFKNQIKRRIAMITKTNKNKKALMGRFMILPLLTIFICLFSFKQQMKLSLLSPATIRVVIDPGHGGVFNGTSFNGIYEKNMNLSISKKIQALSKDYHVEVILTRENDEDLAGNNLEASLKYRAGLAAAKKADLFISIHMNGTTQQAPQNKYSGFEIYVPDHSSRVHTGSVKLASSITDYIRPDYTIASELKERGGNIRVLDQASVPAVLIECGYIDNQTDLSWMQNDKNQEKIARDILEGIQKFGRHATAYTTDTSVNLTVTENVVVTNNLFVHEELRVTAYDSTTPYKKVEVEAEFPGGNNAWGQYLFKNLNYPKAAVKNEIQGEVLVEFVVNTDGKISGVHAISGPDALLAESVRVIKESGKWIPARDQGKKVASYKTQPINYKLEPH